LIEFANGDLRTGPWAKLRSDMGHPEPFCMDMVGIGNENYGKDYIAKYEAISRAIHEKYPDMLCVMCNGIFPHKPFQKRIWDYARKSGEALLVDEHSYHTTKWYYRASRRFDRYPRCKAGVYFGEYAANGMMGGKMPTAQTANRFETALAEAAFLTGLERNSDIVKMSSYAPLFCLAGSEQWAHNMIYFNPAHVCLTANYMVQKMFSSNIGSHYFPCTGGLPKGMYVSATQDESTAYIKIVNAGAEDAELSLRIDHMQIGDASLQSLHSADLLSRNTLEFKGDAQYAASIQTEKAEHSNGVFRLRIKSQSVNVLILHSCGALQQE
jgi:alpha-L-arabinofuranosidase